MGATVVKWALCLNAIFWVASLYLVTLADFLDQNQLGHRTTRAAIRLLVLGVLPLLLYIALRTRSIY